MSHTGQKDEDQSGLEEGQELLRDQSIDEDTVRPDREQKRPRQRQPMDTDGAPLHDQEEQGQERAGWREREQGNGATEACRFAGAPPD